MNTHEPKCKENYILDKNKCMCIKKPKIPSPIKSKKQITKKRTRCPKGTHKNPKTGKCESTMDKAPMPKLLSSEKKTAKKRTRCPKGTHKNPKTGKCEPTMDKAPMPKAPPKVPPKAPMPKAQPKAPMPKAPMPKAPMPKAPMPKAPSPPAWHNTRWITAPSPQAKDTAKKKTRCPKGTRKNPKTGKCESTKTVAKTKKKEKPIVIPSSTPVDITHLSREVAKHINQNKPISPDKMTELIKSFSPSIHARLEQFNSSPVKKGVKGIKNAVSFETQRAQMLDCLNEDSLISKSKFKNDNYKYTYLYDRPMPHIYVNGECYPAKNIKSQKMLLKSLNDSIEKVDMSKLITPKQYASNCWFNSFFVVFFVGDKGRKFSKALRHLMITQHGPKEKSMIDNLKMRKTMFAFNLAIEASLTGNPIAYKINTNSFVVSLAESMPPKYKKIMPKYDKASNPIVFYDKLMNYFENVHNVKGISITNYQNYSKEHDFTTPAYIKNMVSKNSDLITIEIYDTMLLSNYNKSKHQKKPLKLTYDSKEYTLGAAVIRDTKRRHFCCVCNVNGKEYGFDGASFKRLNPFEWRKLLNKDKEWTFEGSNWKESGKPTSRPILWNFMNGYQILFYYRTK